MSSGFDVSEFRHVVSHFATGVVVVCGNEEGELVGFAAQSFVSLSLEPPLILFCPQKTSTSWPRIRSLGKFCINVLAEDQGKVSDAFAMIGEVADIAWHTNPSTGTPALDGVIATIDCTLNAEHDAGDHTIVVADVHGLRVDRPELGPLLFFQGAYGHFAPAEESS